MVSIGETLCLRWNEFETNIKQGFSELRSNEDFFDVTVSCGSRQIKAHRVILSACSSFFRSLLKSIPHEHPFLYLRGIEDKHLESLLCFMYNGEVRVEQEDLDAFLLVAEELQVKGLIQESSQDHSKQQASSSSSYIPPKDENILIKSEPLSPFGSPIRKRGRRRNPLRSSFHEEEDVGEEELLRSSSSQESNALDMIYINNFNISGNESGDSLEQVDKNNGTSENELLDAELLKYVSPRGSNNLHNCLKCSYSSSRLLNVKRHVEARHFLTDGFKCEKCPRIFKTRDTRSKHFLKKHKGEPVYYATMDKF